MRLRAPTAFLALAFLLACSGYARRGSAPTGDPTPQSYGGGIGVETRDGGASARTTATMVIVVIDDAVGKPLPGATVRLVQGRKEIDRGPTDSKGRVLLEPRPGRYLVQVTGCGQTVVVDRATEAVASVAAGSSFIGELRVLAWKRRFHPTNSVRVPDAAPWEKGQRARVEVRIEDRCTFGEGPNASIAAFRWETSGAVVLAEDPPKRAGSDGWAKVIVSCRERGNGRVIVFDPRAPADRVDLLQAASAPPDGQPWCE